MCFFRPGQKFLTFVASNEASFPEHFHPYLADGEIDLTTGES